MHTQIMERATGELPKEVRESLQRQRGTELARWYTLSAAQETDVFSMTIPL